MPTPPARDTDIRSAVAHFEVNRGLFEEHKLIFCAMLTFKLFQLGRITTEDPARQCSAGPWDIGTRGDASHY